MDDNKYEKYLPIGTVCLLEKSNKKCMIIGYLPFNRLKRTVFDYIGCLYPEGLLSMSTSFMFNHEHIKQIYFMGCFDHEQRDFSNKINAFIAKNGGFKLNFDFKEYTDKKRKEFDEKMKYMPKNNN